MRIYYVTQTLNNCESLRTAIPVTLNTVPPPTATSEQTFCLTDNPTVGNVIATALSGAELRYYDYDEAGGFNVPLTDTLWDGRILYIGQVVNGCESSTRVAVTIHLNSTPSLTPTETADVVATGDCAMFFSGTWVAIGVENGKES
jgi:hypothetical protein